MTFQQGTGAPSAGAPIERMGLLDSRGWTDVVARNRRPTGKPSWPRILISGDEGARKSWVAAELSADPRIGGMYWLEVGDGENTADEYGQITDADYDIILHDGSWLDIYKQLGAHWRLAKAAEEAGELPIALVVDAMSGIQSMLQDMADIRARRRLAKHLADTGHNPDDAWSSERDVSVGSDLWTLIKKRHVQFMRIVHSWPGPVVLTSRERVATIFDANGNPTRARDWTLESRKDLPSQCTAWIRLTRANPPLVIKLRSARHGLSVMPDHDKAQTRKDFTCAALIFDWVGCVERESRAPETREFSADQLMPDEMPHELGAREAAARLAAEAERLVGEGRRASTRDALTDLWQRAIQAGAMDVAVDGETVKDRLSAEAKRISSGDSPVVDVDDAGLGSDERAGIAQLLSDAAVATSVEAVERLVSEADAAGWTAVVVDDSEVGAHLAAQLERVRGRGQRRQRATAAP